MKKLLFVAAAILAIAGCEKPNQGGTEADAITIAPESKTVGGEGGNVQVIVTSTGDWKLAAKGGATYDWVSADKTSGTDGDIVKFAVNPNTEEQKTAEFVFTCGTATAPFTVISMPGEVPTITITSGTEVKGTYTKGKFTVAVALKNVSADELEVECSEEWMRKLMVLEGDVQNSVNVDIEYDELSGLEARTGEVTFKGGKANSVKLTFTQSPRPTLSVTPASANLDPATAGTLEVTVTANVAYNITYSEGSDWLTNHKTAGNVEKWDYSAYTEDGKVRTAVITFTEKNPAEGVEPLTATVTARQSNLKYALNIANARVASPDTWSNGDVMKLGKVLTIEMLAKHSGSLSSLGYLFGIERRFLVRHGDNYPRNAWELVCARTTLDGNKENAEWKLQVNNSANYLPADKWFHVAVTLDGTTAKIYLNGNVVAEGTLPSDFKDVDFTEKYTGNSTTQKFFLGWGYGNGRDWKGQVAELRIWNKALTQEEIKADGHYYSVAEDAAGLVGYWKMNEGDGSVIYDSTSNGNHFTAQTMPNGYTWSAGAKWEELTEPIEVK